MIATTSLHCARARQMNYNCTASEWKIAAIETEIGHLAVDHCSPSGIGAVLDFGRNCPWIDITRQIVIVPPNVSITGNGSGVVCTGHAYMAMPGANITCR